MKEQQILLKALKNAPEHTLLVRDLCKQTGWTEKDIRQWLACCQQGSPLFRDDGTVTLTEDVLTEENLLAQTPLAGVTVLEETDSTNAYVKAHARELLDKSAVIALKQTAGRGRNNRHFFSDGRGLYMSLLLKPETIGEAQASVTTMAAAAAALAGEEVTGQRMHIKWVNDLYYRGKKVAGILTEGVTGEHPAIVLGIGVNLYAPKNGFDPAIENIAGALFGEEQFLAEEFTASFIRHFLSFYEGEAYLPIYREKMMLTGQTVIYEKEGQTFEAEVLGVDDACRLIVFRDGHAETLFSGEITLKTFDKY